jgi:hypothetical protein
MIENRDRNNFDTAVRARRAIWNIQSKDDDYKDERFKARNNLAHALQESSRRIDGEEGDKQIEEAIGLLQGALDMFDTTSNETHKNIARANLAQALGLRAARQPGLAGQADIDRAKQLCSTATTPTTPSGELLRRAVATARDFRPASWPYEKLPPYAPDRRGSEEYRG